MDKTRAVPNRHFAAVDWGEVSGQARVAYAREVQREGRQIALNALHNLAAKAKAARWYGTGGTREAINEWACKGGTAEVGEPDALFDCGNEAANAVEEKLKTERAASKKAFEAAVKERFAAIEAAEAEAARKKKEAEEAKKKAALEGKPKTPATK